MIWIPYKAQYGTVVFSYVIMDWLSMILRLRQHNIGYTADVLWASTMINKRRKGLPVGSL